MTTARVSPTTMWRASLLALLATASLDVVFGASNTTCPPNTANTQILNAERQQCVYAYFGLYNQTEHNNKTCTAAGDIKERFKKTVERLTPCYSKEYISALDVSMNARTEAAGAVNRTQVEEFKRNGGPQCIIENRQAINNCSLKFLTHVGNSRKSFNNNHTISRKSLLHMYQKTSIEQQAAIHNCSVDVLRKTCPSAIDIITAIHEKITEVARLQYTHYVETENKRKTTKTKTKSSRVGVIVGSLVGVAALLIVGFIIVRKTRLSCCQKEDQSFSVNYNAKEAN